MDHWHVTLEGFPEKELGDVITKDGEIIGTWACDENDYCEFTPTGAVEFSINGTFIGLFCREIAEWHEQK